jgi:hypothetical protein
MSDDPGHDQDVGDGSHRIEHKPTVRERLAPYGSRLVNDVRSVPGRAVNAARNTGQDLSQRGREAVRRTDERLDTGIGLFRRDIQQPARDVMEQRAIRGKKETYRRVRQTDAASPFSAVPPAPAPRRKAKRSGASSQQRQGQRMHDWFF